MEPCCAQVDFAAQQEVHVAPDNDASFSSNIPLPFEKNTEEEIYLEAMLNENTNDNSLICNETTQNQNQEPKVDSD